MSAADLDFRWKEFLDDSGAHIQPSDIGNRRIGIAICGLGRMGSIHLSNLLKEPRVNLRYCLDNDQAKLDFFSKKYFFKDRLITPLTPDKLDIALDDPEVEAFVVSSPTFTHEEFTRRALEANKHVMCEKPLALTKDSVSELYKLAKDRNITLLCAFNRRYDPSFRHIKERIDNGAVGDIHVIKTCSRDSPTPSMEYIKGSGGIFHDCIIHDMDLIIWMLQDLPYQVTAIGHKNFPEYKEIDDFDTVAITMKFKSGTIAIIDVSRRSCYGYDQRCEVYGTKGMIRVDGVKSIEFIEQKAAGVDQAPIRYSFASRYHEAYSIELVDFLNIIEIGFRVQNGSVPPQQPTRSPILNRSKPHTVLALQKIMDACSEAAKNGKTVFLEWPERIQKEDKEIQYW